MEHNLNMSSDKYDRTDSNYGIWMIWMNSNLGFGDKKNVLIQILSLNYKIDENNLQKYTYLSKD